MTEFEDDYDKLRILLSPPSAVPLPKNELTEKLLHNIFTEEEAYIIGNGIKKTIRPTTARKIRKRTGISKKILKDKLSTMEYSAKLIKFGPFYILLPYLPGFFEFYFTTNRDDPERIKKAGEAHYELIKRGFHAEHASTGYPLYRVIPAVEPTKKSIEVNQDLVVQHQILPYEILKKYLSKYKTFAIQPCSCRTAAKLSGNPCKCTDENFCVSAGILARKVIKDKVGEQVSLEKLMEIMKKAEKEGLVHETINTSKASMFICNCCSCCCGFLKTVKELGNYDSITKSNFEPLWDEEKCTLCDICLNICPMGAIKWIEDSPKDTLEFTYDLCIGCGLCASNCPSNAISLKKVRNEVPIKGLIGLLRRRKKDREKVL